MRFWWLGWVRAVCGCSFALSLACCNPLAGFVECENGSRRDIAPGEVVEGVDVDASVAVAFNQHQGELVWSETGDRSNVTVTTERGRVPASTTSDCDGRFDGFVFPAQARMVSDDGFVDFTCPFRIYLDRQGKISMFENVICGGSLDFEALKAAGETPWAWISGFDPRLLVTLVAPEMKPQNAEVLVEEALGDSKSHLVSIGSLTFP